VSIEQHLTPLRSQSQRQNLFENSKKLPKGIDKMKTGFIIRIVGKSGEKGVTSRFTGNVRHLKLGGPVGNQGD
jgi:hypothetical protein